jgi:hypothetical protein
MENNKLIATFMGLLRSDEPVGGLGHGKHHWFYKKPFLWDESLCSDDELRYDTSWAWLMPVVEKIWDLNGNRSSIFYFEPNEKTLIVSYEPHSTNITDCYLAVVEYIKWHNKQNGKG